MATIKYAAPIDEVRGTMAGLTYSRNGASTYAKRYAYPIRRRSQLQSDRRGRFSRVRQDWSLVTPSELADWAALAAAPPEVDRNSLGEVYLLNPAQWHARVNLRRLQAGLTINRTCPDNVAVAAPDSFEMTIYNTADETDDSIFTYTMNEFDGFQAVLMLSSSPSSVRTIQTTGWLVLWASAVEGATSTRINEELVAAFGTLQPGAKIFGRLYKQSLDGIRSTHIDTTTVVLETP